MAKRPGALTGRFMPPGRGAALQSGCPQSVEPRVCYLGLEVRAQLFLAPIPEEARGGNCRNGQQTDTEDTDKASRVWVHRQSNDPIK